MNEGDTMNQKEPLKELPPKYYLENFATLLSFAEEMYGELLNKREQDFIAAFRGLSEDAQCLFLRFLNRKGLFFRTDKLVYPEIADIRSSLDELLFRNFVELPGARHAACGKFFLAIYNKPELLPLLKELKPELKGAGKLKKTDLIEFMLKECSWPELLILTAKAGPAIKHNYEHETELLKFLFFGYTGGDMSEFVVRDLGMVRYESPEQEKLVARFNTRQELDDQFSISLAYEHFRELRELNCPETLYSWYKDCSSGNPAWSGSGAPLWTRLTLKLARILERHRCHDWALEVYSTTSMVPSRERRVRLLQKTGAVQEALELCHQIKLDPQNAEEQFFAHDFIEKLRKKKARKSTTLHLKEAEEVIVSREYCYQVEKGVMRYYENQGKEALHSENYLWRSLFGLVFWDIIFNHDAPVYHSPFQRAPSDLYLPAFLESRLERMLERMQLLSTCEKLAAHVEKVYDEKWGTGNPLINWHENTLPLARAACSLLQPAQLQKVLIEMARNLKENGRGFPDLFVWTEHDYLFVEVKSPNDSLSAQQLFWLRFFRECGIKAKVLKVEWEK